MAYDCVEKMVYWTDITGPAISKASLTGGDVVPVVTKGTARVVYVAPLCAEPGACVVSLFEYSGAGEVLPRTSLF